jgi:hypothetical protein
VCLVCVCLCRHEAAAHHTLLQHAPPGSLLIDTGFVSPAFEAQPAFYSSILSASPSNKAIGSLGDIPLQAVRELRLGCSLDGLLLTPKAAVAAAAGAGAGAGSAVEHRSSSSSSSSSNSRRKQLDTSRLRRAPPYSWAAEAGYDVSCVEVKCPTPFWSVKDRPWAFGFVGPDRNKPYLRMRAGHYCQTQLSMLVTGGWLPATRWAAELPGLCLRCCESSVVKFSTSACVLLT